jgi:hypothetical protein
MYVAQEPLSRRERTALVRILTMSSRDHRSLAPRQRAALDAYASVLSSPPLAQGDVVSAARSMIRIWAEIGAAVRSKAKSAVRARKVIPAELLDLDDVIVEPRLTERCQPRLTTARARDPFEMLAADLMSYSTASETATELIEPLTPNWRYERAAKTSSFSRP